jgi:hypothetical protein
MPRLDTSPFRARVKPREPAKESASKLVLRIAWKQNSTGPPACVTGGVSDHRDSRRKGAGSRVIDEPNPPFVNARGWIIRER